MALELSGFRGRQLSRSEVIELMDYMYMDFSANEAIEQILAKQDPSFISYCLEKMVQDKDPETRCDIVYMMARLELPASIRCVDILLSDQNVDVRCAGCRILAMIDGHGSMSRLIHCLQTDASEAVRYIAVDGIGIVGDVSAIPVLQRVAESDTGCDYEGRPIREKAIMVIGKLSYSDTRRGPFPKWGNA